MTEYTPDDFANARFAEHEDWGTAARTDDTKYPLWFVAKMGEPWFMEDHEMAESGWRPIVEADHPARPLAGYRAQVKELREENDRLERILQAPLSLKDLEVAWGSAEQADECREGDTLIELFDHGAYHTYSAAADYSSLPPAVRILHRAPQPEPWQGLAKVLRTTGVDGQAMDPEILASVLYERGVRATGGDEA